MHNFSLLSRPDSSNIHDYYRISICSIRSHWFSNCGAGPICGTQRHCKWALDEQEEHYKIKWLLKGKLNKHEFADAHVLIFHLLFYLDLCNEFKSASSGGVSFSVHAEKMLKKWEEQVSSLHSNVIYLYQHQKYKVEQ